MSYYKIPLLVVLKLANRNEIQFLLNWLGLIVPFSRLLADISTALYLRISQ